MQNTAVILQQDVVIYLCKLKDLILKMEATDFPETFCVFAILEGITNPEDHNLNPLRQENPTFVL
jgi:hypothetical protein